MEKNEALRRRMRAEKVAQWQLAEYFGVSENTVCRRLRTTLNSKDERQINEAIEAIIEGRNK